MLSKFGNLAIRKILVVTSAYVRPSVRPSVRTDSGGGGGMSQDNPTGGGECHLFLAGNRAVFINGKKKFKRILVEGEKFKLRKLPSKDFIALFSSRGRACLVLKHNRVSEVFKGFKVHDFEYYGQRNYILKWKFNLCH